MTMESDEDQCDLEALEALIEDSDGESMSSGNHDRKLAGNNYEDQAELDILANLVAEDCDFDEMDSSNLNSESVESEKQAALVVNSQTISKNVHAAYANKKSISPAKNRHNMPSSRSEIVSSVKDTLDIQCNNKSKEVLLQSECKGDSSLITTETLLQEMAKMQQKMSEMQKMLEQQQVKQHSSHEIQQVGTHDKLKSRLDQQISVKNNSKPGPIVSNSQPNEENNTKGIINGTHTKSVLRLLSDNDDSLFSQPRTASLSTPQSGKMGVQKAAVSSSKKAEISSSRKADISSSSKIANVSSSSQKALADRNEMKKDLFGDSDSDFEMDNEDKQTLSEAGRDLQQLLHNSQSKRDAHTPQFSMSDNYNSTSQSWNRSTSEVNLDAGRKNSLDNSKKNDKNSLQCKTSSNDQAKPVTKASETEQHITENYSKIRIVNPLISSSLMKTRMEGRKMINVSRIHMKLKTPDLQGDWVTIAVIVSKTDSKSSSSGKPYSILKLNDLEDLDNSVSFFLFGEVHKQLWKTEIGTVVGVLNPSIMDSMEKKNSEPAFTIKNPSQLMIMGRSKDLGWCTGVTKKGNKCGKFINKKFGDSCAYHVQAAYRKVSAARLEFHGSTAGIKPKSFEQKIFSKDCAYMYGGQTFVPHGSGGKSKKGVTLNKLQKNMSASNKISTMSIQNLTPKTADSQKGGRIQIDQDDTFLDMITVPSPGSMNFVAFLKNNEKGNTNPNSPVSRRGSSHFQSITPKELIKQHQQMMQQKKSKRLKHQINF